MAKTVLELTRDEGINRCIEAIDTWDNNRLFEYVIKAETEKFNKMENAELLNVLVNLDMDEHYDTIRIIKG